MDNSVLLKKMAFSAMNRQSKYMEKWCYEFGLILKSIESVWQQTEEDIYFRYIKDNMDRFIDAGGSISGYDASELNLDHINPGKTLLFLYRFTGDERYMKAASVLRNQIYLQPRNLQRGFWHKKIYPHQMWLDGIYMCSPFYAQYASMMNTLKDFDDIALQVILINEQTRDPKTGLLYHAWDESKGMKWSDDITGCSPHFWGRAMGWYSMALVDILDFFPENHKKRSTIIAILCDLAEAIVSVQDSSLGVWYQVLDKADEAGNYPESSASCMFTYALAKGIRMGYLDDKYIPHIRKAFDGILEHFIDFTTDGFVDLKNVCSVAGLGGNPYRDGSFSYYISEPVVTNDYKRYGPLILAVAEIIRLGDKIPYEGDKI